MGNKPKHEKEDRSEIVFYSFWKPDPIPTKGKKIAVAQLRPIGTIGRTVSAILRMPNINTMAHSPVVIGKLPLIRLMWKVGDGVILKIRSEHNNNYPQIVMTISVISAVSDKVFYQLYVLMHEHLGVTVFDECKHEFLTTQQFKNRLK